MLEMTLVFNSDNKTKPKPQDLVHLVDVMNDLDTQYAR